MRHFKTIVLLVMVFCNYILLTSCSNKSANCQEGIPKKSGKKSKSVLIDDGCRLLISQSTNDTVYVNSVKGHEEKDTIVGNFTGRGVDTLYVRRVVDCGCSLNKEYDEEKHLLHELDDELVKYYMVSANPSLGRVELLGYATLSPRLVNEGDLDGNGTSEVGYLPVWRLSQWRIYHLFTFKDGTWKCLIDPGAEVRDADGAEFLFETGFLLRGSGDEIASPSGRKGLVKIKYQTRGINALIKDTLVSPDFKNVNDGSQAL